jgi:hypothetical protein
VTRIDPGVVSLVAGLRGHERQAAEELASGRRASRSASPLDASPTAITPTMICTLQEALSAGTIALEISSRNARVAALQKRWDRLRRPGSGPGTGVCGVIDVQAPAPLTGQAAVPTLHEAVLLGKKRDAEKSPTLTGLESNPRRGKGVRCTPGVHVV